MNPLLLAIIWLALSVIMFWLNMRISAQPAKAATYILGWLSILTGAAMLVIITMDAAL